MKKGLLSMLIAGMMAVGLVACGGSDSASSAGSAAAGSSAVSEAAESTVSEAAESAVSEAAESAASEASVSEADDSANEAAAESGGELDPSVERDYNIAVVGKAEAAEWWQIFKAGAEQAGKDYGVNAYYRSPELETDIQEQVNIVQDCMTQGIDALVLSSCDPTALNDVIIECNKQDIPVILVNDTIDDDQLIADGGSYETYVGIVQYNAAKLAGEYAAENFEPCDYAIVEGIPGVQAHTDRAAGFADVVNEKGFNLVASQTGNCDANEAYDVATNILTANPDVKLFWTTNAEMGNAIVSAIENLGMKAGKDGIRVFDFDCTSDDITNISAGTLVGTIDQDQFNMSYTAVEVAIRAIEGEKFDGVGSQVEVPAKIVTAENIADYQ